MSRFIIYLLSFLLVFSSFSVSAAYCSEHSSGVNDEVQLDSMADMENCHDSVQVDDDTDNQVNAHDCCEQYCSSCMHANIFISLDSSFAASPATTAIESIAITNINFTSSILIPPPIF